MKNEKKMHVIERIKRIPLRWILFAWMVFAVIILGKSDIALLGSEDYFVFLPLVAFAVVLCCSKSFSIRDWFARENRTTALLSLLLTLLTLVMLPIGRFLSGPMFSPEGMQIVTWNYAWQRYLYCAWNWTGLFGGVILSIFGCYFASMQFFLRPKLGLQSPLEPEKPLFFGIYRWTLLIAAIAFVAVYSASPGLFDQSDQAAIWRDVMERNWKDANTVTYEFFVWIVTLVIPSRRMVSLVFWAAWVFVSNTAIGALNPLHPRAGKWYAICSCILFLPMLYLSSMLKDMAYTIALFALSLQILRILRGEGEKGWRWFVVGAWMYFAQAFRREGIVPVLLTAAFLFIYFLRARRKQTLPFVLTMLGVFVLNFLVMEVLAFGLLDAKRNDVFVTYGTPMYLMAAVADSGREMDEADIALLEELMPVEEWIASRSKSSQLYTVDAIARVWGVPGERIYRVDNTLGMQYCRLAVKYFFRYPGVVLEAFFTVNSLAWEITTPEELFIRQYQSYSFDMDALEDYDISERTGFVFTGFAQFTQRYAHFLGRTPILRDIHLRGGIPLLCLLFGNWILWRKGRKAELLISLPIFGAHLIQLVVLCAQISRYFLPSRCFMVFLLMYACFVPKLVPALPIEKAPAQVAARE